MLMFVHVLSPILSMGVAFFSWISAVFWLFAIVMGNPDGTEKRDDGRATVIMVRNWWEKYFLSALRRR
jgi:cytochrome bd-type quinol oxidase subunit 1